MFAPTRGFSQLTTAFLAKQLQGIHRRPLPACHITHLPFPVSDDRCKRPRRSAATSEARRRSRRPRASVKDPSSGRRANGNPLGRPFDVHLESGLAFRRECSTRRGVEVWGLEPQTYGLQSHRSSHLSYTPGARQNRSASVTTKKGMGRAGLVSAGHR